MSAALLAVSYFAASTAAISDDFTIWDFCDEVSTDCSLPLGTTRYAYGSAHQQGSSKWYLIGGTGQSMTDYNFVTEDSVIEVDLASGVNLETLCYDEYPHDLPMALGQGAGAVINDNLYSFGGFSGSPDWEYLDDVFHSDIVTESNFSSSLSPMPAPISAACSVTVGSNVYIIGGLNDGTITNQTFVYDASMDSWSELTAMNVRRFAPGCAYYDGKIYVFGGQTAGGAYGFGAELNSTEIYDIGDDSWTISNATLSWSAHWLSAAFLNVTFIEEELILVMGGSSGYPVTVYDNVDIYHIESDSIWQETHMRHARYAFGAIAPSHNGWFRNTVLMAGGKDAHGEVLSTIGAIYCGETDSTSTETLPASQAGRRNVPLLAIAAAVIGAMQR